MPSYNKRIKEIFEYLDNQYEQDIKDKKMGIKLYVMYVINQYMKKAKETF